MQVDFDLERLTTPVINRITDLSQKRCNEFPEFFGAIQRLLMEEKERRAGSPPRANGACSIELPQLKEAQSRRAFLWCIGLRHFFDAQGYASAASLFHAIARCYEQAPCAPARPRARTPDASAA